MLQGAMPWTGMLAGSLHCERDPGEQQGDHVSQQIDLLSHGVRVHALGSFFSRLLTPSSSAQSLSQCHHKCKESPESCGSSPCPEVSKEVAASWFGSRMTFSPRRRGRRSEAGFPGLFLVRDLLNAR